MYFKAVDPIKNINNAQNLKSIVDFIYQNDQNYVIVSRKCSWQN